MTFEEHIENLEILEGWEARFEYIIELAEEMPALADALKTEENLVRGCTSRVWMVEGFDHENRLNLQMDSDAVLVRGLLALVKSAYEGVRRDEIASVLFMNEMEKIGLLANLSPNRRSGLASVLAKISSLS
ncbi:MAG: Fe-S cluster assembly protein SufE [Alphaproteobacteria bacterium CG_4_10_14_0_8_um_filter_53_9]|nr:MAG: Fe-S cluster assembly protein SufE [Alphaproteobacteria bacterium CG_4_10_14_0_8_um_filter_53_9]